MATISFRESQRIVGERREPILTAVLAPGEGRTGGRDDAAEARIGEDVDPGERRFALAVEVGDQKDVREWAMTMMLVARAIERIGDNAVDIGEQVAFVVTGLFREFEDASHPGETPAPAP